MSNHRNRLKTTISAVASAGLGDFTISAASSGYRTFVSGDNALTFDCLITEGTAWEVRTGCTYTHSGTTLSRGTLEDSSTGSAITFTTAAVISQVATAGGANAAESVLVQADRSANYGFFVRTDGSTVQTVTDAGWRVVHGGAGGALQTVEWNVGSVWSADSNGRATLPSGRWMLGGMVTADSLTTVQRLLVGVAKNGEATPGRLLARSGPPGSTNIVGVGGTVPVESNGSDYFTLSVFVDGSGTHTLSNVAGFIYFWGEYLGPTL